MSAPSQWEEEAFDIPFSGLDVVKVAECNSRGSYEGSGCAIAKTSDGKYYTAEYSHCSCYGPFDRGSAEADGPFDTYEDARRNIGTYERDGIPETEPVVPPEY